MNALTTLLVRNSEVIAVIPFRAPQVSKSDHYTFKKPPSEHVTLVDDGKSL